MANVIVQIEESELNNMIAELHNLDKMEKLTDELTTRLQSFNDLFFILEGSIRKGDKLYFDDDNQLMVDDLPIHLLLDAINEKRQEEKT